MRNTSKIALGIGVLIAAVYLLGGSGEKNVPATSNEKNESELAKKISNTAEESTSNTVTKGKTTPADMKEQPNLSAAMIAQYATDNIKEKSWENVSENVTEKKPLDLWVVANEQGTAYHFNVADNSPYYRLKSTNSDSVIFYSADDKKITEVTLDVLAEVINKNHTDEDIYALKKKVAIQVAEQEDTSAYFDKIANEYVWQSGSGSGGYAVLNVKENGTFSGDTDSYLQNERFKSSFKGTFSDLVQLDDLSYEATIKTFSYRPKETIESGMWTIHFDKPTVISKGDKVRFYLKGYEGSKISSPDSKFMDPSLQMGNEPIKSDMIVIEGRGWREVENPSD